MDLVVGEVSSGAPISLSLSWAFLVALGLLLMGMAQNYENGAPGLNEGETLGLTGQVHRIFYVE
jgi:hypothetical protein